VLLSPVEPRKKGKFFLGISNRRPDSMSVMKRTISVTSASRTMTGEAATVFLAAPVVEALAAGSEGCCAGPLGVGGAEQGALQSKSWQYPTRLQMKHQRVRQLSWYTMLQPPLCSTMAPHCGQGRKRGALANLRLVMAWKS